MLILHACIDAVPCFCTLSSHAHSPTSIYHVLNKLLDSVSFQPCSAKGAVHYVHRRCLEHMNKCIYEKQILTSDLMHILIHDFFFFLSFLLVLYTHFHLISVSSDSIPSGWHKWEYKQTTAGVGEVVHWWHWKTSGKAHGRRHRSSYAVPPVQSSLYHACITCQCHLPLKPPARFPDGSQAGT